jgi:penicillin-binding protein 1A
MKRMEPRSIEKAIKISVTVFMVISTGIIVFGLVSYIYLSQEIPSTDALKNYSPPTITRFFSDDGEIIAEFFTERRKVVSLSVIPAHLVQAFVAGEDARFFEHKGVDFLAILRALSRNISSGEIVQGGSTITQQVVKSLLLSPEKSFLRKIREAILAYKIEKYLSKEDILYLYLNQIYLGHGAYGVQTAARTYFGKDVNDLNLAESALLAGLTQAPSKNSPYHHPLQARKRQTYVLERMVQEGLISPDDLADALITPLKFVDQASHAGPVGDTASYFVDHVKKYVEEKYGKDALLKQGLKVYTTIDMGMQRHAEAALNRGLKELEKREEFPRTKGVPLSLEGALICFDLETGYVRTMVGGRDYRKSQFNRATQARRQTGSAFKPIVYAAALDRNYTPASLIVDSPVIFEWGDRRWTPKNFEERFLGPITLRSALTHSVNVVTVKIAQDIGVDYIMNYAKMLGISAPLHRNLSMALGSSSLSLYELAKAYAVFANQGRLFRPTFIKKILDRNGNLLEENLPLFYSQESSERDQIISPGTAYLMTNLLQGVVQNGTGYRAKVLGRPVAGKTGTTDHFVDAWFIGYSPDLLTGVWVGFDDDRPLGENETGSRAASPIWVSFMSQVLKEKPLKDFPIPDGVEFIEIDPNTGRIPEGGEVILECFKEGTGPPEVIRSRSLTSADFFKLDFNLLRKK